LVFTAPELPANCEKLHPPKAKLRIIELCECDLAIVSWTVVLVACHTKVQLDWSVLRHHLGKILSQSFHTSTVLDGD
jgi:hypothetical protein